MALIIENRSIPGTLQFVEGLRLNEESAVPTKLVSGDLDGDDIKDLIVIREVITARGITGGIAVFEPIEQTQNCPGDANKDNSVDVLDLLEVISSFGTSNPNGDVNADGNVDVLDLLEVIGNFGQTCN